MLCKMKGGIKVEIGGGEGGGRRRREDKEEGKNWRKGKVERSDEKEKSGVKRRKDKELLEF